MTAPDPQPAPLAIPDEADESPIEPLAVADLLGVIKAASRYTREHCFVYAQIDNGELRLCRVRVDDDGDLIFNLLPVATESDPDGSR